MMRKIIDTELVLRLAREGYSNREVAKLAGVHMRTVTRLRVKHGISETNPRSARRMTPELRATIEGNLNDGWSFLEISRTHDVSEDTLRRHFPGRAWTHQQVGEYGALIHYALYPRDHSTKRWTVKAQVRLAEAEPWSESTNTGADDQTFRDGVPTAYRTEMANA
jgi:IS30 family transposase